MSVVNDVTRFVDGCVQGVEYFYNCRFDRDALDFSRVTVHLRFLRSAYFKENRSGKTIPTTKCSAP